MQNKNFYITTFGCKVNQYESQFVSELLGEKGYTATDNFNSADIVIINSCTVTSTGDNKVYKLLRRVRRENANCILVVMGCLCQAFPSYNEKLNIADIITGNTEYEKIPEFIEKFLQDKNRIISISPHQKNEKFKAMSVKNFSGHTRAFVKIQDGCNNFCSYCIIPYARGRVRSKHLDMIKNEVETLAENGYKEIVLTGINLSCYGREFGKSLIDAVKAVADIDGVERVRLGSLEQELLSNENLEKLSKIPKFCPQFHISLQSGSDETLKRMNRHYTTNEYSAIVEYIRKYFDNPAVTTDIMVGFAGESDEEFCESCSFVKKVSFAKVHVFPYSKRPGTVASEMENQVPQSVKINRAKIMSEIAEKSKTEFLKNQVGRFEEILIERESKNCDICCENNQKIFEGYTKNYVNVKICSDKDLTGQTVSVYIEDFTNDFCIGKL